MEGESKRLTGASVLYSYQQQLFFTHLTLVHHHIPEQLLNKYILKIEPYTERKRGRAENWMGTGEETHCGGE